MNDAQKINLSGIRKKLKQMRTSNVIYLAVSLVSFLFLVVSKTAFWSIGLIVYIFVLNTVSFFNINNLLDKYKNNSFDKNITYEEYSFYFQRTAPLVIFLTVLVFVSFSSCLFIWNYNITILFFNDFLVFFIHTGIVISMLLLSREVINMFVLELALSRLLKDEIEQ